LEGFIFWQQNRYVMQKVRISAISYLNTVPFVYGILYSGFLNDYELYLDYPSACAKKLIENQADIGLVPVASLSKIKDYQIISDYCIGAQGPAASVLLVSKVPLPQVKEVFLDFHSMTSAALCRILAANFWNIEPKYRVLDDVSFETINTLESVVLIGDKTFGDLSAFSYRYDLAQEWFKFKGMPFVFAVWAANKKLDDGFVSSFNKALEFGVNNIDKAIALSDERFLSNAEKIEYLNRNIRYDFDDGKKQALWTYLDLLEKLPPLQP